ncbi:putative Ig domain-containing protein, partial [Candidatus Poribacteria bacterium]
MRASVTGDAFFGRSISFILWSIAIFMMVIVSVDSPMAHPLEEGVFSKNYVREKGPQPIVEDDFSVPDPGSNFLLRVQNGENDQDTVSQVTLSINGEEALSHREISKKVDYVEKAVTLQQDNTIAVKVKGGSPGCFISVNIVRLFGNNPPEITSTPVIEAAKDALYTYDVEAFDADGDVLVFSLSTSPDGMTIDASTGLITWTPLQTGNHNVVVEVSDAHNASDTQSFAIDVSDFTLNSLSILPIDPWIDLGQVQQFSAIGVYSDGEIVDLTTQVIWTSSDSSVATINAAGLATSYNAGVTNIGASKDAVIAPVRVATVTEVVPPVAESDSGWIDGMVYDSRSGLALEGARVTVEGVEGVVYSDANGQFFYPCPGSDIYRVF